MSTSATLLTIEQVCERLRVSRATAYRMVDDGRLPALQLGGRGAPLRVEEEALQRLVERSRMRPEPEAVR